MRFKGGRFLIGVITAITLVLWLFAHIYTNDELFTDDANLYVAQISGGLALVYISISFLLSTRLLILEKLFAGLDDVYRIHTKLSKVAFVFILAHPVAHILRTFGDYSSFSLYALPGNIDYYNYGIFSVYIFTLLILVSIVKILPYHIWKYTHLLMGIPYVLAIFHTLEAKGPASEFNPQFTWYILWIIIGISSYMYKSFVYGFLYKHKYHVEKIVKRGDSTRDIYLLPDSKPIKFIAGQFAFFKFDSSKRVSAESHPYSFSSSPDKEYIRISVKELGDHSKSLQHLEVGDTALVYGPHGQFNADFIGDFKRQIWISGGIGVTPFISMLEEFVSLERSDTEIYMYYCTNTKNEAEYQEEINALLSSNKHLHITGVCKFADETGHIQAGDVFNDLNNLDETLIMICGPLVMMHSLAKQFMEKGVPEENITFEEFNFK